MVHNADERDELAVGGPTRSGIIEALQLAQHGSSQRAERLEEQLLLVLAARREPDVIVGHSVTVSPGVAIAGLSSPMVTEDGVGATVSRTAHPSYTRSRGGGRPGQLLISPDRPWRETWPVGDVKRCGGFLYWESRLAMSLVVSQVACTPNGTRWGRCSRASSVMVCASMMMSSARSAFISRSSR